MHARLAALIINYGAYLLAIVIFPACALRQSSCMSNLDDVLENAVSALYLLDIAKVSFYSSLGLIDLTRAYYRL